MNRIFYLLLLICTLQFSCTNTNFIPIKNQVYLTKVGEGQFELNFDKGTEDEWTYRQVDSLSVADDHYGFLFYGMSDKQTEKKWFYVTGAPMEFKKGFGNWNDLEFRKHRMKELHHGEELYKHLKPMDEVWEIYGGY